ncbi:hypothetical protein M8756_08695 [Lutimaribacter sp. EGI FJ00015]|uniref:Uncharacterized protein n=1 Tax=Lutimaribacter degradans TaxID=2945989 RepID=A0ACC5ZW01_9RHOB|nr:hypothetical protein [Lutimaribacter sp. EGI FJ00013]MCM2562231.1 hypothetical protein [Lutimaribacter sp. EGI FJ00013]MCO0613386.1 hypothetical protein [Lutimaribacter sp. EGI FJ00015]MCO0636360.1 hypothetical protein [Lutimaribacter sp. EGI FJ00014]
MGVTEDLADELARDTLKLVEITGNEDLVSEVSNTLGASSTPTQEAFMSAIRVRMAVARARQLLRTRARAAQQSAKPATPGTK